MYTRQQYMTNEVSHEQYYGQFVTEELKQFVLDTFRKEVLCNAYQEDKHFNTIMLSRWDVLTSVFTYGQFKEQLRACGDVYSLSSGVCLLKECARQIVSE